eukprot:gene8917-1260_t
MTMQKNRFKRSSPEVDCKKDNNQHLIGWQRRLGVKILQSVDIGINKKANIVDKEFKKSRKRRHPSVFNGDAGNGERKQSGE